MMAIFAPRLAILIIVTSIKIIYSGSSCLPCSITSFNEIVENGCECKCPINERNSIILECDGNRRNLKSKINETLPDEETLIGMIEKLQTIKLKATYLVRVLRQLTKVENNNLTHLEIRETDQPRLDEVWTLTSLETLALESLNLKELPTEGLNNLQNLKQFHIRHNRLTFLKGNLKLPNLAMFNADSNEIRRVSDNYFEKLPNLKLIDLSNNMIKVANSNLCSQTLNTLNLNNNNVNKIDGSFAISCEMLSGLSLNNNDLEEIGIGSFPISLTTLDLSNNRKTIKSFPRTAFESDIPNKINLNGDVFICSCELQWIKDDRDNLENLDTLICKNGTNQKPLIQVEFCQETNTPSPILPPTFAVTEIDTTSPSIESTTNPSTKSSSSTSTESTSSPSIESTTSPSIESTTNPSTKSTSNTSTESTSSTSTESTSSTSIKGTTSPSTKSTTSPSTKSTSSPSTKSTSSPSTESTSSTSTESTSSTSTESSTSPAIPKTSTEISTLSGNVTSFESENSSSPTAAGTTRSSKVTTSETEVSKHVITETSNISSSPKPTESAITEYPAENCGLKFQRIIEQLNFHIEQLNFRIDSVNSSEGNYILPQYTFTWNGTEMAKRNELITVKHQIHENNSYSYEVFYTVDPSQGFYSYSFAENETTSRTICVDLLEEDILNKNCVVALAPPMAQTREREKTALPGITYVVIGTSLITTLIVAMIYIVMKKSARKNLPNTPLRRFSLESNSSYVSPLNLPRGSFLVQTRKSPVNDGGYLTIIDINHTYETIRPGKFDRTTIWNIQSEFDKREFLEKILNEIAEPTETKKHRYGTSLKGLRRETLKSLLPKRFSF